MTASHSIDATVFRAVVERLSQDDALNQQGLFRIAGPPSTYFFASLVSGRPVFDGVSCVSVAQQFKKYLREAEPPLIAYEDYASLLLAEQIAVPSARVAALRRVVDGMPAVGRELLGLLLALLGRVAANAAVNYMDVENVARMLTPSLLRNYPHVQLLDPAVVASEIALTKDLIQYADHLFSAAGPAAAALAHEDKKYQRDRKRKTMALMTTAEVPEKFLIIDNRRPTIVQPPPLTISQSSSSLSSSSSSSSSSTTSTTSTSSTSSTTSTSSTSSTTPGSPRSPRSPRSPSSSSLLSLTRLQLSSSPSSPSLHSVPASPGGVSSPPLSPRKPREGGSQISVRSQSKFLFSSTTYSVSFGTLSAQRTANDFVALSAFLTSNYPHLSFAPLPDPKREQPKLVAAMLSAFLEDVTAKDELFMDSLFVERWLQFVGSKQTSRPR